MSGIDIADLYDEDIAQVGIIWQELMKKWAHRPNTQAVLSEFAKDAEDRFYKAGFIIHVDLLPCLQKPTLLHPQSGAPVLEIIGRVSDASEHKDGLDHERKRFEVLDANAKGEKFRGQKEKAN